MKNIKEDASKYPVYHALIILFLFVGLSGINLSFILKIFTSNEKTVFYLDGIIKRLVLSIIGVVLIYKYEFDSQLKSSVKIKNVLAVIPAFLVVINNLPIIGLINKNVVIDSTTLHTVLFLLYALSIGIFEEVIFRGILFPLCVIKLNDKKNKIFWAVVLSSAMFSLTHLLNLLGGAGIVQTIMQIGYSFLIGAMSAIVLVKTGNIYSSVILHFVFDIGGLFVGKNGIAYGNQWDILTIIITAVLGLTVFIYMLYVVLHLKNEDLKCFNM